MSQTDIRTLSILINADLAALTAAKKSKKENYAKRFFMHVHNSSERLAQQQSDIITLMQEIISFQRHNQTAFTYTESAFLKLYHVARSSSNPLIQKQAQNKLLAFFFIRPPSSYKRKLFLLQELAKREDLTVSGKVVTAVLDSIIMDYIKKEQYKQDADLSIAHSAVTLLEQLSTVKSHNILTNPLRTTLRNIVANLQTLSPEVIVPHLKKWHSKFSAFSDKRSSVKNARLKQLAEAPLVIHLMKQQGLPRFND